MKSAPRKSASLQLLRALLFLSTSCVLLSASSCVENIGQNTVETATSRINRAMDELSRNSENWQETLRQLSNDLRDTQSQAFHDVDTVAQRAIGTTGTEYRCNADFTVGRIRQHLTAIVDQLNGRTPARIPPAVCLVTPRALEMRNRPSVIEFFGYVLDGQTDVVMTFEGGQRSLNSLKAVPTPYLLTVNVSPTSNDLICNLRNRRILLNCNGKTVSEVDIVQYQFPGASPAPPPLPERIQFEHVLNDGGGLTGASYDRPYGVLCSPGYHRTQKEARNEATGNVGWCEAREWVDDNPKNCTAFIHVGKRPFQGVSCRVRIWEAGDEQPPPQQPPCPCW